MRHRKNTDKLGRKSDHRAAVLSNLVSSLIKAERVTTTLRLARSAQRYAEKMITLAKRDTLHARRQAIAFLRSSGPEDKERVRKLFAVLGPRYAERKGGYTRITRLAPRRGDAAPMAVLEYVGATLVIKERKKREEETLDVQTEVAAGADAHIEAAPAEPVKDDVAQTASAAQTTAAPEAQPAAAEQPAKPASAEKPATTPKPAKSVQPTKPAPADKPAKPAAKTAPAQEPKQGKDRKGGLGRFIKGIFGSEDK